ncbi:MAG: FAD-dependent oxidoreductase [Acidobacteriia bacterium]|nr:FAD-dependent oxidoreductase [Terriglobia bacterium]
MNECTAQAGLAFPHVVILGAGPAGLAAAWRLARRGTLRVTVLEQREEVGGYAGSFTLEGCRVDYGSHRLHPATPREILEDLRSLLGADLLRRPRHGRIRLQGRWIHFPLQPLDLLTHLPPQFLLGVAADAVCKPFRTSTDSHSFAGVLERGLGRTICREFYFPYAEKLWGFPPTELAATQARRRISGDSLGKLARKLQAAFTRNGQGRSFYYPRRGYGQISEALAEAARAARAEICLGAEVTALLCAGPRVRAVQFRRHGSTHRVPADAVLSTLPVQRLVERIEPPAPENVRGAAAQLQFRGLLLIYLVLAQDRFSEFDAHYFPEPAMPLSRLSEPKNYSGASEPRGRTVLCAELPADPGQPYWQMSDAELGHAVCAWVAGVGLPVAAPVLGVVTRRLRCAYPVYRRGYEEHFAVLDHWLAQMENLLTFGRQGLFVHDNTHHALIMAYAAAECVSERGELDHTAWRAHRRRFEAHVVED